MGLVLCFNLMTFFLLFGFLIFVWLIVDVLVKVVVSDWNHHIILLSFFHVILVFLFDLVKTAATLCGLAFYEFLIQWVEVGISKFSIFVLILDQVLPILPDFTCRFKWWGYLLFFMEIKASAILATLLRAIQIILNDKYIGWFHWG